MKELSSVMTTTYVKYCLMVTSISLLLGAVSIIFIGSSVNFLENRTALIILVLSMFISASFVGVKKPEMRGASLILLFFVVFISYILAIVV